MCIEAVLHVADSSRHLSRRRGTCEGKSNVHPPNL